MMETKIYTKQDIPEAAAELRAGHLVSFPTETVYGLGAIVDTKQLFAKFTLQKAVRATIL